MKLMKDTGSLTNWMMNNPGFTEPKVGMDVTELHWTDRSAWRIIEVDPDHKGFTMARYTPVFIGKGYGDETYRYTDENGKPLLNLDYTRHVKWFRGKWRASLPFNWIGGKKHGEPIRLSFGIAEEYRDPSF